MTESDMEKYYFYRLYSIDFDTTKHTLGVLRRYKRKDVRFCLLRDVVVCYSRPFSGNKGKTITKHYLPKSFVPKHLRSFHEELITIRNQLFAHNDYTYRRPKVANWSTPTQKAFPMSFRGYDYDKLDSRIVEIEELVKVVADSLQLEIDSIEKNL
jgi:hypothetical protein